MSSDMNIKIRDLSKMIFDKDTPLVDIDKLSKDFRVDEKSIRFFYEHGVFITDNTIDRFCVEVQENPLAKAFRKLVEELFKEKGILVSGKNSNNLRFLIFYLLHEEGHFKHYERCFIASNKTRTDFYEIDKIEKLQLENKYRKIVKITDEVYLEYQREYHKIEFEKIADEFAINKILYDSRVNAIFEGELEVVQEESFKSVPC